MKKARFCNLLAMAAVLICSGMAQARSEEGYDENLRFVPGFQLQGGRIGTGNLRLLIGAGGQAEYSDNINFASGDPGDPSGVVRSDWIVHLLSSLYLDKVFEGTGGMRLGYEGDWAFYQDFDENDWEDNLGRFDLDYFGTGGLIARVRSSAALLEDVYGNENFYNLGIPTQRSVFDVESRFGFEFADRLRFLLLGDYFRQEYDEIADFTQNWDEWTGGAGAEVRVAPETWLFVRYAYGERQYTDLIMGVTSTNVADYDYQRLTGGVGWDLGSEIRGEANFGYQWLSYSNSLDAGGNPFQDENDWVADAKVYLLPTGKSPFEARESSVVTVKFWRAFRSEGADTRDFFIETGIGGVVRSEIFTDTVLSWGLDYYNLEYENAENEKAGNGKAAFELMYKIQQWLAIGVGADWQKRNSTVSVNDYEVIRYFFTLKGAI